MKNVSLIFCVFLSCVSDYELHRKKREEQWIFHEQDTVFIEEESDVSDTPTEPPTLEPDIEIEFLPDGSTSVKPGCTAFGEFLIKNVGGADLIINQIDSYTSIPADVQVISNYVPFPLTLTPGSSHSLSFNVNESDNLEDRIIMVVKSNDPDEPVEYSEAAYTSDMGIPQHEEFTIQESKAADVLMIVDNSCSMQEEQSMLSSNSELFIDALDISGIDYRIAVITTDKYDFVGPVITPAMSDPSLELSNQVNVGTYGSPVERGFLMASKALGAGGMAAPGGAFLRRDARLSIVWISDEDDFSAGTTYDWSSDFWSKKSSPGEVSVWGIIGDPIYGCMNASPGDVYYDLITAMGGGWSSICSTDWGSPMSSVAGRIGVDSTLELSGNPIASSIKVFVNGTESLGWVYVVSSNSVSFNPGHIPPIGSRIVVQYSVYGDCE